jgi:hypothetical protein
MTDTKDEHGLSLWRKLPRPLQLITVAGLAFIFYQLIFYAAARYYATYSIQVGSHRLPYFNALTSATFYLALGTVALAYSAFRQAELAKTQTRVAEAIAAAGERDRLARLAPHLDFVVIPKAARRPMYDAKGRALKGTTKPFEEHPLSVRNFGPGAAANLRARFTMKVEESSQEWDPLESVDEPSLPREFSFRVWERRIDERYLLPDHDIPVLDMEPWPTPPNLDPFEQEIAVTVELSATDLEGNPAMGIIGGLAYSERLTYQESLLEEVDYDQQFFADRSRWQLAPETKAKELLDEYRKWTAGAEQRRQEGAIRRKAEADLAATTLEAGANPAGK